MIIGRLLFCFFILPALPWLLPALPRRQTSRLPQVTGKKGTTCGKCPQVIGKSGITCGKCPQVMPFMITPSNYLERKAFTISEIVCLLYPVLRTVE